RGRASLGRDSGSVATARDDGQGPSLLRLDAGILGDLHPGLDLLDLVGPEGSRIAWLYREAELVDPGDHLRLLEAGHELARQAIEDRLRRRRRREEARPRGGIGARHTLLIERRHLGKMRVAPGTADRQAADLLGVDLR